MGRRGPPPKPPKLLLLHGNPAGLTPSARSRIEVPWPRRAPTDHPITDRYGRVI